MLISLPAASASPSAYRAAVIAARRRPWPLTAAIGLCGTAAYFLSAKLGLLTALPVGIASLLWPATGIALVLALRLGPAVVVGTAFGAFLAHWTSAPDAIFAWPRPGTAAPMALIGISVAVQLVCGLAVIRAVQRRAGAEPSLGAILLALACTAVVMSVVRAVGVTAVVRDGDLIGSFSPRNFGAVLGIGDLLGTLCMLPLATITGIGVPVPPRRNANLRAELALIVFLPLSGWLATVTLHDLTLREESAGFAVQSGKLVDAIAGKARDETFLLGTLRSVAAADPDLNRDEFHTFAALLLPQRPDIQSIGLIRRVGAAQRAQFERSRSAELGRPVTINVIGPDRSLRPAPADDRDRYVLDYVEPERTARRVVGLDVSSEPRRDRALRAAAAVTTPVATAPLALADTPMADSKGIVVLMAVTPAAGTPQAADRFVGLTLRMEHWADELLEQSGSMIQDAAVSIDDVTDGTPEMLTQPGHGQARGHLTALATGSFFKSADVAFEGRRWRVSIGLPADENPLPRRIGWWIGQILPQLLMAILLGTLLLSIRQLRARDNLEMQVAALSRRFLGSVNEPAADAPAPRPAQSQAQLDAGCASIWRRQLTRQFYEPVVDLRSGALVGFESLLRFPGVDRPPPICEFVAWTERNGVIRDLTRSAIRQALDQIEQFQKLAGSEDVPWISVNVSATDLGDAAFVDDLLQMVRQHPSARRHLKLEITESVLMHDVMAVATRLQLLRGAGLRIALDDFGTGYASLSYLRQLPLDTLKIDRSFISRIDSDLAAREIVEAMIALAQKLRLEVVAEGIEDGGVARAVLKIGCVLGQGYGFSAAAAPEIAGRWISDRHRFALA